MLHVSKLYFKLLLRFALRSVGHLLLRTSGPQGYIRLSSFKTEKEASGLHS